MLCQCILCCEGEDLSCPFRDWHPPWVWKRARLPSRMHFPSDSIWNTTERFVKLDKTTESNQSGITTLKRGICFQVHSNLSTTSRDKVRGASELVRSGECPATTTTLEGLWRNFAILSILPRSCAALASYMSLMKSGLVPSQPVGPTNQTIHGSYKPKTQIPQRSMHPHRLRGTWFFRV